MRRPGATTALALVACLLTACSDDRRSATTATPPRPSGSATPATTGSAPTTASTSASTSAPAMPSVRELRTALVKADTGHVSSTTTLDELTTTRIGDYRISTTASRSTTTVAVDDGLITITSVVTDGLSFAQVDNGNGFSLRRCWFTYAADDAAAATSDGVPAGAIFDVPSEVSALLAAREEGGTITTDLYVAAAAFGSSLPHAIGIPPELIARMPITLTTGDRTVTVTWSGTDVVRAARDAGVDVPPGAEGVLGDSRFEGTISRPGTPVTIAAPPRDQRIEFDPEATEKETDDAIRTCELQR